MAVTEVERTELANRLVLAIGKEATETLMQCIIPEGRDQLATKDDLKVLESTLRGEFAEFKGEMRNEFAEFKGEMRNEFAEFKGEMRSEIAESKGEINLALAKQTRMYLTTLAGFMLTTWGALIVPAVV
ncbi:hypothetical protein [Candidatus Poriferisocius sp.]|uniref:hypothetical protein n=1 Tax=Candidatus Poriferisocius sp. TaxID=3101276 RepID=UPI003B010A15